MQFCLSFFFRFKIQLIAPFYRRSVISSLYVIRIVWPYFHACQYNHAILSEKQELSYRKQIARQLCTQYAECIYRHKLHLDLER